MSVIQKHVESALQPVGESDIVQGGQGGQGGRRGHGQVEGGDRRAVGQECQLFALILQGHWDMCASACAVGGGVPTA